MRIIFPTHSLPAAGFSVLSALSCAWLLQRLSTHTTQSSIAGVPCLGAHPIIQYSAESVMLAPEIHISRRKLAQRLGIHPFGRALIGERNIRNSF